MEDPFVIKDLERGGLYSKEKQKSYVTWYYRSRLDSIKRENKEGSLLSAQVAQKKKQKRKSNRSYAVSNLCIHICV